MRNRLIATGASVACLLLTSLCAFASYSGVDPYEEYSKRIHAAEQVAPVEDSIFGDQVNLYNGTTTFDVTDVSIPGNNDLPVELRRQLLIRDLRLMPQNGDGLPGFDDWSLDVPYIDGTFTQDFGWVVNNSTATGPSTSRCSDNTDVPYTWIKTPSAQYPISYVDYYHIWNGDELHIPGKGNQELLANTQSKSPANASAASYPWVTTGNWKVSCIGSVTGMAGEGFKAVSPNGDSYSFDYAVSMPSSPLANALVDITGHYPALRARIFLLATHVQDRFGNWVNYSYSGNHLTAITSSDGRSISLNWSGDSITSVTSSLGEWDYGYSPASWTDQGGHVITWSYLSTVTRPDKSKWTYTVNSGALVTNKNSFPDDTKLPAQYCQEYLEFMEDPNSGSFQYTVGAPSGASAVYSFTYGREFRDMVPLGCAHESDPNTYYPLEATDFFDTFYLTNKQISGPGLTTASYTYSGYSPDIAPSYSYPEASAPYSSSGYSEPYEPPISCSACPLSKVVTVKGPLSVTNYTYGIQYARNEGQLLGKQIEDLSGNVLQTTGYTYVSDTSAPSEPFADIAGVDLLPNYTNPMGNRNRPVAQTVVSQIVGGQIGATFTNAVNSFDAFARATSTIGSSSLGYTKTDTTSYQDDTTLWVLGLVTQTATNGIVDSQTSFDSHDMPTVEKSFGRVVSTKTWDYAADQSGTLASIADGDGHTTAFSTWYRGVPKEITYAYGTSQAATESATVNGNGWITSVTDENGFTTSYGYDAMGRLASITYPAGSGVTWNSTALSFTPTGNGQYNTPVGAWVQTVTTGNEVTNTFFDAFWRPLVTEHYDTGDKGDTLSQTVTRYDAAGRTIFTSYPTNNVQDYATANIGSHTTYDALNRVTEVDQDWDLDSTGLLATKTTYLPGFKTQVTLPNGPNTATTTSYMAYGSPTMQWPVSISAPESELTTIHRDVFGKPTSIIRTGSPSQTRSFAYNAYQQLCGRTEPETGTTMYGYDGAGNLKWNVPGLPVTAGCYTDTQAQNSGRMVSRTYDGRNRLTGITYPDGFSTATYQYAPDGALLVQSVANDSFPVTTSYSYDERRLLTSEKLCFSAYPCTSNALTFALGYGYDANGHLSSTTYPDGRSIGYAPNALGQPTAAGSYATGVKYFPNGTIASFDYGSGAKYTANENERGLVSRDTDKLSTTAQMDFVYGYDPDGNVQAITDNLPGNFGNVDMTYDALDRLKEADSPMFGGTVANPGKALYGYDVFDNLTSASVGNQSQFNYVYNYAQNQLAKLTDPSSGTSLVTYAYDAQGNLAQKNSQVYKFDMANRLASVPGLATYRYDAAGRRVQKVEIEAGKTLDSDYSRAGNLMYQWDPATVSSTDYIYLGSTLISRVVGNNSHVIGNIDGVPTAGNPAVGGWACSTGITGSITVQLYVGGPWNGDDGDQGTLVATTTADLSSEAAVASACGTNGTNYRFSIPISTAVESQYPKEPIWVYGVSPLGNSIGALTNSGTYTVPANPAAPEPPSSISVPSTNIGGSYTVSWSASSGATSYVLQQESNIMPSWEQVYSGASTSTSVSVGSLEFRYQVQACNANGCSSFSTPSSWVTVVPAAPASISVPSSSYSASIPVSWAASSMIDINYVLEERENGGSWGEAWSGGTTSTTATVSSTGSYQFQIAACASGGCSPFTLSSNVAVTLPPTSAPTLSGPSSSASGTYALNWTTVAGATRYQLNQNINGTLTAAYSGGGTSWSSSSFGNGIYNYQAFACNAAGCGPGSNGVAVTVLHVPTAPASISVPASAYLPSVGVSWSASATATNYVLEESFNGGAWGVAYSGATTSTTVTVSASGTYRFQVAACNASGCGGFTPSGNVAVTPPPAATTSIQACFEPANVCGAVSTTSSASVSGTGSKLGTSGGNFHGSILYRGAQQAFTVTCNAPAGDEGCTNSENLTVGGVVFTFHVSAAWMTPTDCRGLAVPASTSASTASPLASAPAPALASCPWSAHGNITDSSGVPIN